MVSAMLMTLGAGALLLGGMVNAASIPEDVVVEAREWKNEWDGLLDFSCPSGQHISRIKSEHRDRFTDKREDRRWDYECRSGFVTPTCKKWGYVNEYDEIVNFGCPNRGIVTGFESKHDNHHEDRIWKINCCDPKGNTGTCRWTKYINEMDGLMDFRVPDGEAIVGLYSRHSNKHEDRTFELKICSF